MTLFNHKPFCVCKIASVHTQFRTWNMGHHVDKWSKLVDVTKKVERIYQKGDILH